MKSITLKEGLYLNINYINEFLGSATHYTEVARDEFLLMKCCSFERKDLEKHFDRMSRRLTKIDYPYTL